jgi:hypothetical protein
MQSSACTGRSSKPQSNLRAPMKAPNAGLCARCRHCKTVQSARGSAFLMCLLHERDARFEKYPRLPVVRCAGYVQKAGAAP